MRTLTTGRLARIIVFGLALAITLPALGVYAANPLQAQAQASRVKIIVLPLANESQVGGADLAERVGRALRLALDSSGRASIISLAPSAPAVRRAVELEKTLGPEDLEVTAPVEYDQALRLGQALGADMVLWGAITDYSYDPRTATVSITLAISKLDPRTGAVSPFDVTGQATGKTGYAAGEGPLITEAIDAAASQVTEKLLGVPAVAVPTPATPEAKPKKNRTLQTLGALLVAAAVIALASDRGAAERPPDVGPAPASAVATPTEDAVVLSWQGVSATGVTSFNIYRADIARSISSLDRTPRAPGSRVRTTRQAGGGYTLLANVARSVTTYTDISAALGSLYSYQITSVAGTVESAPVQFLNYYDLLRGATGIEVGPAYPSAPAAPSYTVYRTSVRLQWPANPEPFITAYRVYRAATATGPRTLLGEGQPTADGYTLTDPGPLSAGATYFYYVAAVTAATPPEGRLGPARQVVFQPGLPAAPTNVRAEPRIGAVLITWEASPDLTVTGYNVYRGTTLLGAPAPTTTGLNYLDEVSGGPFTYQVASVADGVESARVTAVPSQVSPSNAPTSFYISPPNPSVVANGVSTVDIFAYARDDATGTFVSGVETEFALDGVGAITPVAGYSSTVVEADRRIRVFTDSTGKAPVAYRGGTDPSAPRPTLTVTWTGDPSVTAQVQIGLRAPVAAAVSLSAAQTMLAGDGVSNTVLTATVTDQGGGPMPGITVQFASQDTTIGVVSPASAITNADGKAMVTLTSAAMGRFGDCRVTATVTDLPPAEVTVRFVSLPSVTLSAQPAVLPAAGIGASALLTATVKYRTGESVPDGTVVRFAFDPAGATESVTGARIPDGRERALTKDGIAYSTMYSASDLTNGDADLILAWSDVNDDGVLGAEEPSGSVVVSYTEAPYLVNVTAEPTSIPADGRSVSKIVAEVLTQVTSPAGDGYMPVADGTQVTLSTDAGTFADTRRTTTTATTVGGLVTVFLQSSTSRVTATVTATAGLRSGSVQVEFVAPALTTVAVAAVPASLQADGISTSTVVVRVTDAVGSPRVGVTVTLSTDLGRLSPTTGVTDTDGQMTATFTAGLVAGTATIMAKAGGVTGFATLTLTSGAAQNVSLTIITPNINMPATNGLPSGSGASPTAQVGARVTDKHGNPVVDGTPVFFRTDIGQIDGSALTENGVAIATLTTCNFLDATNKATYRPGWASITAYADNPAGTATTGPHYQIFCGDASFYNWDGSANDTDLYTAYGAYARLGTPGSSDLTLQPNLSPRAGSTIRVTAMLADRNNNPLPIGVPVNFEFWLDGESFGEAVGTTGMVESPGGIKFCTASVDVTPTDFPNEGPVATLTIRATTPVVVDSFQRYVIAQFVGAGLPSGSITMESVSGTQIQPGTHTITLDLRDEYDNRVQDGTPVNLIVQDVQNLFWQISGDRTTTGGRASIFLTVGLIDPEQAGQLTILAGAPQIPPDSDASGSLNLSVGQ